MKKILLMMLIIFTLSGCGSTEKDSTPKIGMLTQLNSTPEQGTSFFDNFNSMLMALTSKNIDELRIYKSVAKYLTENNSEFKINDAATVALVDNFCCAMRDDEVALKNSFNTAIESMKSDGMLDKLINEYINQIDEGQTPHAVEISHIDGADTIKVGVTGDLPPLDLVLADGTPAGFNTAILAEISRRINKNIELIQIDSSARAAALTSGQVDVVFWVVVPDDNSRPKDIDTPAGVSVTEPYYQDVVVDVNLSNLGAGF